MLPGPNAHSALPYIPLAAHHQQQALKRYVLILTKVGLVKYAVVAWHQLG